MASGYTPDTETVREQYTREQPPHWGTVSEKSAEFDRWLAGVKAEALRRFADTLGVNAGDEDDEWWRGYRQGQREALHKASDRADQIEKGKTDE